MYGSEDSKSSRTSKLLDRFKIYDDLYDFFVHDYLDFFGSGTSLLWIMGESTAEGL